MLSETLTAGLEHYRIGPKIRALRLKKKLGLVQLGEHTGLSPAMLSKIERGQLFPTLPTLLRIALVFGVGLEHFFLEEERQAVAVVRRGERLRLPDLSGDLSGEAEPAYFFESLDFPATDRRMESFYAEFPVRSKPSKPHEHGSAEFIYVIEGQLVVTVGDTDHVLDEGDAMYFDSSVPHVYRRESRSMCAAIVVVAA
ncbi:helix-turn-helix domain-containing protein [Piscinibacter sp.]|uniref:helix-turn-helix domain-containing protein n=1 Tax=Piscinibacter sp. TaxID=1903157 RepID=UPI002C0457D1|nr:XRE family transcriptional regulator [Albitalea sp.]HUG24252.1 XRE family transcriptional regulator [Albitalea sp.]